MEKLKKNFLENCKHISLADLFQLSREKIEVTHKNKVKKLINEGKTLEDINTMVSKDLDDILNEFYYDVNKKIEQFNLETQNLVDDIKKYAIPF